jgi:arylsulfatase
MTNPIRNPGNARMIWLMVTRPDIVLVMTDEQRFDWIGSGGDGLFDTPFLDQLAASGVRFENAYSSSTTCVPSRVSLLTGLHHHRVPKVDGSLAMEQGVWTIARALRDAGYETALIGRMHFTPMHADHGFDTVHICENVNPGSGYGSNDVDDYQQWMASEGQPDWRVWDRGVDGGLVPHLAGTPRTFPADAAHHSTGWIESEAVRFLRSRRSDRPLFLIVSFPHPHAPYDPPEPYASMYDPSEVEVPTDGFDVNAFLLTTFARSWALFTDFAVPKVRARGAEGDAEYRRIITAIRGTVRHIDDALARIVGELDLPSSAVFFTSDHGDYGGHRGLYTKVPWIPFDDLLRVPLVAAGGVVSNAGSVVDEIVQTGSFASTCLELAGVSPPDDDSDFASLVPFLAGRAEPAWSAQPVLAALTSGYPTVRIGRHKLIRSWNYEDEMLLFDLNADPGETRSLASDPSYGDVLAEANEAFREALTKPAAQRLATAAYLA